MNTSNMWVTHRERNRTKLCDPPSSVKTPKASGETAQKSSGKPGRGRPSSRWSDWVWHKPRAWAATESLPDPTTPHQVGHWARGAARGGGQNWGRARREAPPAAPSGLGGCVLPGPGRTQGFRAEGSRPAQGRDPLGSTLSKRDRRRLPIPRRRVRRDLSAASRAGCLGVPSGTVRVYWRRRRRSLLLQLLLAAPSRCSCASPCSSSCRRRRRLVPTAPIAAAATTAARADPTRRYSPPSPPGTA